MPENNHLRRKFTRKIKAIPSIPRSYYVGRRRWGGAFPDNILLFSRMQSQTLDSDHLSSYFHHRWVLLVVMEGGVIVQVDRTARELTADTVLLIPPLHLHYYSGVAKEKLCWLYITFDWPGQTPPVDEELKPHPLCETALLHLMRLTELWHDSGPAAGTLLSAEVVALLQTVFPTIVAHAPSPASETAASVLVAAVRREVAADPGRMLSIDELAHRVGISASHLRSEFRAHTGISLGRYLREWRLREAALLLSSENLSVKETAERLGFRDIYAFSRAFSRALGVPPSSLRTTNALSAFQKE